MVSTKGHLGENVKAEVKKEGGTWKKREEEERGKWKQKETSEVKRVKKIGSVDGKIGKMKGRKRC
jgi:hypothetical protein